MRASDPKIWGCGTQLSKRRMYHLTKVWSKKKLNVNVERTVNFWFLNGQTRPADLALGGKKKAGRKQEGLQQLDGLDSSQGILSADWSRTFSCCLEKKNRRGWRGSPTSFVKDTLDGTGRPKIRLGDIGSGGKSWKKRSRQNPSAKTAIWLVERSSGLRDRGWEA